MDTELERTAAIVSDFRSQLIKAMKKAREIAVKQDQRMAKKNAEAYDLRRYDVDFEIGQLVWVSVNHAQVLAWIRRAVR